MCTSLGSTKRVIDDNYCFDCQERKVKKKKRRREE